MDLHKDNVCAVCKGAIERRGEGPWKHVASWNQRRAGVKVGPDCPGPDTTNTCSSSATLASENGSGPGDVGASPDPASTARRR